MSAKKRARKNRTAARRRAVGRQLFVNEAMHIAAEVRKPNAEAAADLVEAVEQGTLEEWMLDRSPMSYRYRYRQLWRGWIATTRSSKRRKRRDRVNRRDWRRYQRALIRAERLYDRREWAKQLEAERRFRRDVPFYRAHAAVAGLAVDFFLGRAAC